jgi:ketosteroid isomerase-like protein
MNLTCFALAALVFTLQSSSTQTPSSPGHKAATNADVKSIQVAERAWLEANYRLDSKSVDASESDDFVFVSPARSITKKQHLQSIREAFSRTNSNSPAVAYELSDQNIRIYDDVALVTDICTVTASSHSSLFSPGRFVQTEVWRNQQGTWKIVHFHFSMVEHGM